MTECHFNIKKKHKLKLLPYKAIARTVLFLIPQKQGQFKENTSQMESWATLAMTTYWNRLEEKRQLRFLSRKPRVTHRNLY